MSDKMFKDQYDDEEVLFLFRKHPVVMRRYLIAFAFGALLGTLPSLFVPDFLYFFGGLAAGFIGGGLVFLYGWIGWHYSVFIVTNQRFIQVSQKGFFDKSVVDIALTQIQMVNYHIKGMQQTMLGFGTLNVQTAVGELTVSNIHHPAAVQQQLNQILRDYAGGA